jgi:hypothetical protein
MRGAIHPLPQYAFRLWCSVKARGQLYLYFKGESRSELQFPEIMESENYIPQILIYPRKETSPRLENNGPVTDLCSYSEDLFFEWPLHSKQFSKPSKDDLALLMMESHRSHVSLQVYNYCRDVG